MLKFKQVFKTKAKEMVNSLLPNATEIEKSNFIHGFVNGAMWVYQNPNIEVTNITKDYLLYNDFFEVREHNYKTFIRNKINNNIFGTVEIAYCGDYWSLSIKAENTNLFKRINTIEDFFSALKYCINDIENYCFSINDVF